MYFIAVMLVAAWKWRTGALWVSRKFLLLLICSIPLPLAAIQLGWIAAEVGRQPWIVYHQMRTADAFSPTVSAPEVLFSVILFSLIYLLLGSLYIFLLTKKVKHGPPGERMEEPDTREEIEAALFAERI
jgi:cytochrome d ubiquinol oxidase subunit I